MLSQKTATVIEDKRRRGGTGVEIVYEATVPTPFAFKVVVDEVGTAAMRTEPEKGQSISISVLTVGRRKLVIAMIITLCHINNKFGNG